MKMYTAQEMRDMAEQILITDDDWYEDAGHMLRQAADMMDGEYESDIVKCRRCQTARSGEGYGDTPPPIGDDSICDRCEIAKRIRENEEVKE